MKFIRFTPNWWSNLSQTHETGASTRQIIIYQNNWSTRFPQIFWILINEDHIVDRLTPRILNKGDSTPIPIEMTEKIASHTSPLSPLDLRTSHCWQLAAGWGPELSCQLQGFGPPCHGRELVEMPHDPWFSGIQWTLDGDLTGQWWCHGNLHGI